MKPDWKDAPEWANYLAMDDDEGWFWYEQEPYHRSGKWFVSYGEVEYAKAPSASSLEGRPK